MDDGDQISERCRKLIDNLCAKYARGRQKVFSPLLKALGRKDFDEMASGVRAVTDEAVKVLATRVARLEGWNRTEIVDCLQNGANASTNQELLTFVDSEVFRENTKNLTVLTEFLARYDNYQGPMLGWGSLPFRHQIEGILDAKLAADQRRFRFTKAQWTAQREWRQQRRPDFLNNCRSGTSPTKLGLTEASFEEIATQTGSCTGAGPMDGYLQFEHLINDVVKDRGHELFIVKNRLPKRMREFTAGREGIYACDPYFLMIIPMGGGTRIFFEKTRDRYGNQLLAKNLDLLRELLTYTIHDDSPTASLELLNKKMAPMLDLKKRVKLDHFEEKKHEEEKDTKTDFDLSGFKVHLPR